MLTGLIDLELKMKKQENKREDLYVLPDNAVLKKVKPHSEKSVQPDWIVKKFPKYADPMAKHHGLSSVRQFTHRGHKVTITTKYKIEIDGKSVNLHASVDQEGRLRCHSTPYESYPSASQLVKQLIDKFPEAFNG